MLSVSPRTIQKYIAAKLLTARKIGHRTIIPMRSLEAFLRTDHPTLLCSLPTRSISSSKPAEVTEVRTGA
jgi:hypothetical protein